MEYYSLALKNRRQFDAINAGFRISDSREVPGSQAMQTYFGGKTIFSPMYTKAIVLDDGVHIRPFNSSKIRAFVAR